MSKKIGKDTLDVKVDDIDYWIEFDYGIDWTDAPDEREFVWAEITDCRAFDRYEYPTLVDEKHMPILDEHARQRACELLNLED